MDYNFEEHILDLLKHNDCVTLPGFGGFILKSVPSAIHGNTIYPPSKKIAFNTSLTQDDELLTGSLMGKYGLSYDQAKNKVLGFSQHISYSLKKEKYFRFQKIGAFSVSEDNRIIFKPFIVDFPSKNSFGLTRFHIEKLPKEVIKTTTKSVTKTIAKEKEARKEKTRKPSRLPLMGLVSSVLLAIGMIGLMASPHTTAPKATQDAGFVNLLFPEDSFIESFDNQADWSKELDTNPLSPKENQENGRMLELNRNDLAKGYYLVVGSYASKTNAERKETALFNQGQDSDIFPAENGVYRVGLVASPQYLEAKEMLSAHVADEKDAWLIKN